VLQDVYDATSLGYTGRRTSPLVSLIVATATAMLAPFEEVNTYSALCNVSSALSFSRDRLYALAACAYLKVTLLLRQYDLAVGLNVIRKRR